MYRNKMIERHSERRQREDERHSSWFQPHIQSENKSMSLLAKHHPECLSEDRESRVQRLSQKAAEEIARHRKKLEEDLYGSISFRPEINPLSRVLGRDPTVQELFENKKGKHLQMQLRSKYEDRLGEECTFKPAINELSRRLLTPDDEDIFFEKYQRDFRPVGYAESRQGTDTCPVVESHLKATKQDLKDEHYYNLHRSGRINFHEPEKMSRDIRLHLLQKEERRRSEIIAREIDELRECTFKPNIPERRTSVSPGEHAGGAGSPVVIKGLNRHLELTRMSDKQKHEAKQREIAAFSVPNVDKFRRLEDGSTIVQVRRPI